MARKVSKGNAAVFTTVAAVSDDTTQGIRYQWQVDGVDLVDGESIPTKSDIGSFFYSPVVDALGLGYVTCASNNCGSGTVGERTATANGASEVYGQGFQTGVRFGAPEGVQKYFSEFRVTGSNNFDRSNGWFGVLDATHWNAGQPFSGSPGSRMAPWFGVPFYFGETTKTRSSIAVGQSIYSSFQYTVGDIIGVTVNPQDGAVNFYKNGTYLGTFRNSKAIGQDLHVFLQAANTTSLSCESLESASGYATNYYFASGSVNQDASIGTGGGNVEVSGANQQTLTVVSGNVSSYRLSCKVTHPTAHNSPISSEVVELDVVDPQDSNIMNFEYYPTGDGTIATLESVDLQSGVEYIVDRGGSFQNAVFYSPDKDMNVELEMFGPRGIDNGGTAGNGGYSVIRFIAKRNVEYAIAGKAIGQFFVYQQNQLLAVVGSGGNGAPNATGGHGAGVSDTGNSGSGSQQGTGAGGQYIPPGQLGQNGVSGSSINQPQDIAPRASFPDGGRVNEYPIGQYWAQQGFAPAQIMGQVKWRHASGIEVTNSTNTIQRGYKPGTGGYRANAGGGILSSGTVETVSGTVTVIDNRGAISIENSTGIPIDVQRYNDGASGTEGHRIALIGYFIDVDNVNSASISVPTVNTRVRASGLIATDNSIALSSGYPERQSPTRFKVAFDMQSVTGGRQSTYVRRWNITFNATKNAGYVDGGFGATGGQGAGTPNAAGGGGSGYHSTDVTVVKSSTGVSTRDSGRLVFKTFEPVQVDGTFTHYFINSVPKRTTSLTFTGSVIDCVAQGENGPNLGAASASNLNCKHYLITMNDDYADLQFTLASTLTAAGGRNDPGMFPIAINKINSSQFRVWFARGGAGSSSTFVRSVNVKGVR